MSMIYKELEEHDIQQLIGLMFELGYSLDENGITSNIKEIRSRGGEVFVAKMDDTVVGCVAAIIDIRLAAGLNGEIVSLVVSEKFRGQGIGKSLVQFAETWLKPRVAKVRIRVNVIRSEAHEFYKNIGYKESKTQKIFEKYL